MTTVIKTIGRDYLIWPMRETKYDRDIESNIIPTSKLSAISSQRSYNGRDASPQWPRLSRVQDSTLPTREIEYHSYKSMERDHQSENLQSMARSYPESAIPRTERRLQVSTAETPFLQFKRSASTSIVVFTYNSSNLEEARRTVKTTKAIGRVSEWRRKEMQLPTIHLRTCGKDFQQFQYF